MKFPIVSSYPYYVNIIWYQCIWVLAVLQGSSSVPWLIVLFVLHILLCHERLTELKIMFVGAFIGVTFDSFLSLFGFYDYPQTNLLTPIPLWHIAIWVGFCGTLRHGFRFMAQRPHFMLPAAMLFAPLSYYSAMRLEAVSFPMGNTITLISVSISWLIALSLILKLVSELDKQKTKKTQSQATRA